MIRAGDVVGVVGGMGPLASAEFLKSIYEASRCEREQDAPVVLMYSDPSFPDRTEAFLAGEEEEILQRLVDTLFRLRGLGATRFVLCCVTLHHLVDRLPAELARGVVSLVDVIVSGVARVGGRHLLLCTRGARELRIFERHPRWKLVSDRVILPDPEDQRAVHDVVYGIKRNAEVAGALLAVERMLAKYGVDSFIAGCTEVHLIAKHLRAAPERTARYGCVDPLAIIAGEIGRPGEERELAAPRPDPSPAGRGGRASAM
jgi:aspartate racemase